MKESLLGPNPSGFCQCGCGGQPPVHPYNQKSKGWVRGEPFRFIHGHNRKKQLRYKIDEKTGCWNWVLYTDADGYSRTGTCFAHRYFYEKFNRKIPKDLLIDHLCRNRKCVNPAHLEMVSAAQNVRRGLSAKLTEEKAKTIRTMYANGKHTNDEIAGLFSVVNGTVRAVVSGRTWRNI